MAIVPYRRLQAEFKRAASAKDIEREWQRVGGLIDRNFDDLELGGGTSPWVEMPVEESYEGYAGYQVDDPGTATEETGMSLEIQRGDPVNDVPSSLIALVVDTDELLGSGDPRGRAYIEARGWDGDNNVGVASLFADPSVSQLFVTTPGVQASITVNESTGKATFTLTEVSGGNDLAIEVSSGGIRINTTNKPWKFGSGGTPTVTQTITGSRGGNAALANLLTELAAKKVIIDGTTA